ncbi:unnamed protein product [Peronospora destructor]|uniref:DNA polymerase beta-like N-terminal domain-containing protein n=1 Tax=Peronospora destructor TaxID=86335 RepID=A0AAV0VF04_9STRA|nr:unnamed protein product [Peronospora destructor]
MLGMSDDKQRISFSREVCMQSELLQPETVNDVSTGIKEAASACAGDEEAGKRGAKREHPAIAGTADVYTELHTVVQYTDEDIENKASKEDEIVDERTATDDLEKKDEDEGPPRKLSRLAKDVCKKPAAVPSNQVVVDAFLDFGDQELHRGQTGQGVTHLRAALSIRDHPCAITSGIDARDVPLVGAKMATQVEQILNSNRLEDKAVCSKVSKLAVTKHQQVNNELAKHDHHDTAENVEDHGTHEQGSDNHERPDTSSSQEARSKPAQVDGNQNINDALPAHVEAKSTNSADEGTAFDHAVHHLYDAAELVASGGVGKAIGCIGEMVSTFVNDKVGLKLVEKYYR